MAQPKRKLAAILSADVVGYSRLMQDDDAATVVTLQEYRASIGRVVERHQGHVVNAPGDNILVEFPSAVEAVQCACEIQQVLKGRNLELPTERRMEFRIGVNLGDVIEEKDGTIYGDGVNIAARMEALADAGGICVSNTIYESVEGKIDFGFDFLGEQPVKNIAKPVRVYRVRSEAEGARQRAPAGLARRKTGTIIAAAAMAVVLVAGGVIWVLYPKAPPQEPAKATEQIAGKPVALAPPLPDKPSIAVLPFTNLSGDPEQEYFVDGLTEDIITALSRNRALFVIARNSTFRYKGEAVDPVTLGRELGVRYIVEGSVRRTESRIRVSAQLIDAATGGHVWAETYDRELTDIFAVQDDLTREITVRAGVAVAAASRESAQAKAPAELSAYDLVLRAVEYDRIATAENFSHDRELLEQAVALAPDYARAHSQLALVLLSERETGIDVGPDVMKRAGEHARRGVALDQADARSHHALSLYYFASGQRTLFDKEAATAIELNPNDAFVLADIGLRLQQVFGMERLAEGAEMARRAMRLNPHHEQWYPWATLREYFFTGHYREALEELDSMGYEQDYIYDQVFRAMIHGQLGNADEARRARDKALALQPDYTLAWHLATFNMHESYHEGYIDGARKAGLPLGDLEALQAEGK